MKNTVENAADRARAILGHPAPAGQLDNFNSGARPGHGLVDFEFAVTIANSTGAAKKISFLSNGLFPTAAKLTAAGLAVDALFAEGTVIDGGGNDLVVTSENSALDADMMAAMLDKYRARIDSIRMTSDQEAQFSKTFQRSIITPISQEGQKPLRIKPYFSTNQQSTATIDMVLSTKGQQFWLSNIELANLNIVDNSSLELIISGKFELPL